MRSSFFGSLASSGGADDDSSSSSDSSSGAAQEQGKTHNEFIAEEGGKFFSVESNTDLPNIDVLGLERKESQDDLHMDMAPCKRRSTGSHGFRRSSSDSTNRTATGKRHSSYTKSTEHIQNKSRSRNGPPSTRGTSYSPPTSSSTRRDRRRRTSRNEERHHSGGSRSPRPHSNRTPRKTRRSMSPLPRGSSHGSGSPSPQFRRTSSGNIIRAAAKTVVRGVGTAGHAVLGAGTLTAHAVVDAGAAVGNTVVHGGKVIVDGTTQVVVDASHAVVDAGAAVGNTVVHGGKVIVDGTTQVVVEGSKAIVGGGKHIVDGTTYAVVGGSKALVDGTTQVVVGGSKAIVDGGKHIVDGTTSVVVGGSKALVGGTTHAIVGTTHAVGYGGKTVFKSTRSIYKSVKNLTGLSSSGGHYTDERKSKWEEGMEVIDSLLDPTGEVYQVMTPEQRKQLAGVKKLLLKAPSGKNNKAQHIPIELIRLQSDHRKASMGSNNNHKMDDPSMRSSVADESFRSTSTAGRAAAGRTMNRRASNFILQEYAGIRDANTIIDEYDDDSADSDDSSFHGEERNDMATTTTTDSTTLSELMDASETSYHDYTLASPPKPVLLSAADHYYVPPEFSYLSLDVQLQVFEMLKWDSLGKWDFNVFELNRLTKGKPLLFLGWAILGAPYSQHAMAMEILQDSDLDSLPGYRFTDEIQVPPEKLCNFVRTIEKDYTATNQYHNGIHGADVLQSLHALIQSACDQPFISECPKINLFSILLAAICHDVCHPGTTNAFHVKLHSELAVLYNDSSVLENWHVAHSFSRMLGLDLQQGLHPGHELFTKQPNLHQNASNNCSSENNILCNATPEQFNEIRKLMIDAILHTDMTNHFQMVNEARGMLIEQQDGSLKKEELTWRMLKFMLHMADISGQAKDELLSAQWTQRCMDEFFAQGDMESGLGMKISPNCDRNTVLIPDSQIGFIRFVVEPAFEVLGEYIPFVRYDVIDIIHANLLRYLEQQELQLEAEEALAKQGQVADDSLMATKVPPVHCNGIAAAG